MVAPHIMGACFCGALQHKTGGGLGRGELDGLVEQRLVLHDAAGLDSAGRGHDRLRGLASSMRVASSLAAKPPNTTE